MSVFAVVLKEPNLHVEQEIKKEYPKHHKFNDTFYLLESSSIAQDVALSIRIKGDDRIESSSGVVFKLNHSYSGFTSRGLWDWFKAVEERE